MSKAVEDRLLGRSKDHKHICSTNHNMSLKRDPPLIIKPRVMSAEKILQADECLSPILFDKLDHGD